MDMVKRAWTDCLVLRATCGAAGHALRFALASTVAQGLGIALVFHARVGLQADGFAERRTHPCGAALAMPLAPC